MAKAGAGNASALSPDDIPIPIPMALTAIAPCFASNVSAHGVALNAEGCHHDCNRGGYRCHRGGGFSSRSDAALTNRLTSSRIAPLCMPQDPSVFANFAEAGAAPVRRGEPRYVPHLIEVGTQ